jgi:hypothetical protein
MKKHDGAIQGLVAVFALHGLAGFAARRVLVSLATSGRIPMAQFQSTLGLVDLVLGIAASLALLGFFLAAVVGTQGTKRTALVFGLLSSPAPLLAVLSTTLLFRVAGLPGMGAGSVIASVFSMFVLVGPCLVMLFILSGCRRLKRGSRVLVLLDGLLLFVVALFPTVVELLALVVMPANLALVPVMNVASYLIYARGPLIALGLALAYYPNRK